MKGTPEQIIKGARESLGAAELMHRNKMYEVAVSRAYFSMFYVASALLKKDGLDFDTHSGVHSAFGRVFAKRGRLPKDTQRWLLDAFIYKCAADYDLYYDMTADISAEVIGNTEMFVRVGEEMISG